MVLSVINNNYDKLIKEISLANSIDIRVCKEIINSPFAYLKHLVTSASEEDGVRLPYVGAFCQKGEYKNKTMRAERRRNTLLANIVDVSVMMSTVLGFVVPSIESAEHIINEAYDSGDYEKLNMIWDSWQEYDN